MSNSELPTRISDQALAGRVALVAAVARRPLRVVAIDAACLASLAPEGVDVGVQLSVERRLALGGPVIVRLGGARLALSRSLARGVFVEPFEEPRSEC
ncbi:MAG TPA: FeoA family protein [Candidatus Limnocylindrales bacterium]